mgnify:CR=1 FL=1
MIAPLQAYLSCVSGDLGTSAIRRLYGPVDEERQRERMIGLLHRHHRELGLDITSAVARTTYANPMEDETMAQAEVRAQQGQPAAAAERLAGLFRGRGASDAVHDRYRELLIAAGDLLNWVLARRNEGRVVQFVDAHRLVALFFGAMGINEHARVQVRKV